MIHYLIWSIWTLSMKESLSYHHIISRLLLLYRYYIRSNVHLRLCVQGEGVTGDERKCWKRGVSLRMTGMELKRDRPPSPSHQLCYNKVVRLLKAEPTSRDPLEPPVHSTGTPGRQTSTANRSPRPSRPSWPHSFFFFLFFTVTLLHRL